MKRVTLQKVSMSGESQDMDSDLLHELAGTDAEGHLLRLLFAPEACDSPPAVRSTSSASASASASAPASSSSDIERWQVWLLYSAAALRCNSR